MVSNGVRSSFAFDSVPLFSTVHFSDNVLTSGLPEALMSTVCVLVTAVIFSIAFSGVVFWPIQAVGHESQQAKTRYQLSDMFILTFQIQVLVGFWYLLNINSGNLEVISGAFFCARRLCQSSFSAAAS